LKFEFGWFFPISGQIGPVYRYRTAAVSTYRSGKKNPDHKATYTVTGKAKLTNDRAMNPGMKASYFLKNSYIYIKPEYTSDN